MDMEEKRHELERLRHDVERLENEIAQQQADVQWPPREYYTTYHVLAGCVLGATGAMTSLLFNIIGSSAGGLHPLQLIRVYLTFPLGDAALQTDSGLALAIGCCLYLATGTILGVPFQLVLSRWFPNATLTTRFAVVSVLGLLLWVINFYGILSWLQPLLLGGRWIVEEIPWWVAATTHLVFAWTMLLVPPLGVFIPYQQPHTEAS